METGVKTTSTNAEIIPAQTAEAAWTWSTDTCACVSRDIPEVRVKSTWTSARVRHARMEALVQMSTTISPVNASLVLAGKRATSILMTVPQIHVKTAARVGIPWMTSGARARMVLLEKNVTSWLTIVRHPLVGMPEAVSTLSVATPVTAKTDIQEIIAKKVIPVHFFNFYHLNEYWSII